MAQNDRMRGMLSLCAVFYANSEPQPNAKDSCGASVAITR